MPDRPTASRPFDMRDLAGERWPVPDWHLEKIAEEMASPAPKDRMMGVVRRMDAQTAPDFSGLDWDAELAAFAGIEYPAYYTQPFHSVPGGYLSEAAAEGDRAAMEAIYEDAHPRRSLGMREEIAALVPADARFVVDLGGGTADAGAALARRLPEARVLSIDASPFMTIAGRHQNAGLPNLRIEQGFAESTGLDAASVDAVTITLVFHECPDPVKAAILAEVRRILRPGGTLVLSDTPQDDLHGFRGFYEPYKEQWLEFDPERQVERAGFVDVASRPVAPPLWSVVARVPA
jgi:SAM-dependent methyltransferase